MNKYYQTRSLWKIQVGMRSHPCNKKKEGEGGKEAKSDWRSQFQGEALIFFITDCGLGTPIN